MNNSEKDALYWKVKIVSETEDSPIPMNPSRISIESMNYLIDTLRNTNKQNWYQIRHLLTYAVRYAESKIRKGEL